MGAIIVFCICFYLICTYTIGYCWALYIYIFQYDKIHNRERDESMSYYDIEFTIGDPHKCKHCGKCDSIYHRDNWIIYWSPIIIPFYILAHIVLKVSSVLHNFLSPGKIANKIIKSLDLPEHKFKP